VVVPVVRGEEVRIRCAAAASSALRSILGGQPAPGRILGSSGAATWIGVAGEVVVVAASDAVRLPNGVALGIPSGRAPLGVDASDCTVGGGVIVLPDAEVRVVRWWDPRPALPAATRKRVLRVVTALLDRVDVSQGVALGGALAARDVGLVLGASRRLLGRGDGLTPAGDDLVAGALAACLLVGGAIGDPSAAGVVGSAGGPLSREARRLTTSLSAALLRHACRGEVADPAAGMILALTGRAEPEQACETLCAVGHSSGPALAAGILVGAAAAAGEVMWSNT
jgi:hypothetical protein